jgi:hypothetical protein
MQVARTVAQDTDVDVSAVSDEVYTSRRQSQSNQMSQLARQEGFLFMARSAFLAEDAPEHRQGEAAVTPPGGLNNQGKHDIVKSIAEDLARLGRENGVEEDATVTDALAAFVTEGVIDSKPDDAKGDQLDEEQSKEDLAKFIEVPVGAREEVIDAAVVADTLKDAELPDLRESAGTKADEPGFDDTEEVEECFLAKTRTEGG